MRTPPTPLLALALDGAGPVAPAALLERVLAAERAGVALVTLADSHRLGDGGARLDAVMTAAWLGARTNSAGIVAAADTTVSEPFLLASQVATVDFVSHGRAGWLVQVSGSAADGGYVGPRSAVQGDAAWVEAAEYVEVVRRLWDSWEDGAEIRDLTTQRFIDRDRIHHIDFGGDHLAVKGPSITPRPPQGQPPVAVAVGAGDRRAFALAAEQADLVFLDTSADPGELRAAARGRELRVLADDAELGPALERGFDGIRSGDLEKLAAAGAGAVDGTLRGRLGLVRPLSRYVHSGAPT